MNRIFFLTLTSLYLLTSLDCFSQTDTLRYYFDEDLKDCSPARAIYFAIAFPEKSKTKLIYYRKFSGLPISEGIFDDTTYAVKNGPYIFYDEEGKISSKGSYRDNTEEGYWVYWTAGRISDSVFFEKGKDITRIGYAYHPNGLLNSRISNTNNGKTKTTEITIYDKEGNLERNTRWVNGTGDQVYYYPNGNIKSIDSYKKSDLVSTRYFKPDGTEIPAKEIRKLKEKLMDDYAALIGEKTPSFPGGSPAFRSYFEKNFRAPFSFHEAVNNHVRLVVTFYLNKDGYAYGIRVESSTDMALLSAVEAVFKYMPAWNMKGLPSFGPIQYNISLNRGY